MNRVEIVAVFRILAIHFVFLSANAGVTNCVAAYGDDQRFKITTRRDDDKVETKANASTTHFLVHSPFGISQAVIDPKDNHWPDIVTLRFHLKGLEYLKVSNGTNTLEATVSSQDGKVRLWKDGEENSPLVERNLFWTKIRMVGEDEKPTTTIPLKNGYFELQLPKAMLDVNPKSIELSWIDYYR